MVDHINGDGLDNRRENLRLGSNTQNLMNRGKQSNNKSGFKGVCVDNNNGGRWRASIKIKGKKFSLGTFKTPEEAALAYDAKAKEVHGGFAKLNFNT